MSSIDIIDLYYTLGSKALSEISDMYKDGDISDNEILIGQNRACQIGIDLSNRDMVEVSIPEFRYKYFDADGKYIKSGTLSYDEILKGLKLGVLFKEAIITNYRKKILYVVERKEVYTDKYKFDTDKVLKELDVLDVDDLLKLLESWNFKDLDLLEQYIASDSNLKIEEDSIESLVYLISLLSKLYGREDFIDLYDEEYQYRTQIRINAYEALRIQNWIKAKGF